MKFLKFKRHNFRISFQQHSIFFINISLWKIPFSHKFLTFFMSLNPNKGLLSFLWQVSRRVTINQYILMTKERQEQSWKVDLKAKPTRILKYLFSLDRLKLNFYVFENRLTDVYFFSSKYWVNCWKIHINTNTFNANTDGMHWICIFFLSTLLIDRNILCELNFLFGLMEDFFHSFQFSIKSTSILS